jgi:hypothetical protein
MMNSASAIITAGEGYGGHISANRIGVVQTRAVVNSFTCRQKTSRGTRVLKHLTKHINSFVNPYPCPIVAGIYSGSFWSQSNGPVTPIVTPKPLISLASNEVTPKPAHARLAMPYRVRGKCVPTRARVRRYFVTFPSEWGIYV